MNNQLAAMLLTLMVVACLPITTLAQQTDTSSYFPLGMWGIWLDEAQPPYSLSLSTTQWGRERDNWQEIAGNFVMALMKGRQEEDSISAFYPNLKYRLDVEDNIYGTNDSHTIWWWIRFSTELGDSWRAGADIRIQDLVNRWSSRQALYSYLVANECPVVTSNCAGVVSQAEYWNRVQYAANKLKALDPNPNHKSIAVSNDAPPQGFTDVTPDLDVLQMDCYQFRHSSYYSDQQADIDALLYNYNLTMQRMQDKRTEWQAVIQSQEERRTVGCSYPRRPTFLELRVQAYLALSRGSRGIHYFVYGSYTGAVPGSLVQMPIPTDMCDITGYSGLVDYDTRTGTRLKWEDVNQPPPGGIMPFANVKALNLELAPLVPVIRKLRVYDAFPNAPVIPSGNIARITSVTGDRIEIGVFKRMDQGSDSTVHFMLVNRVCNNADGSGASPQAIVVSFNHPTFQWLQISEVVSGKQWLVAANGSFTDTLAPGSGKLYRLENGYLFSLATQNKSTISGATWPNSSRHLAKKNGKLHETFFSGDPSEVFYRRKDLASGNWEVTRKISAGNGGNGLTSICVAVDNSLHVVWQAGWGPNDLEVRYSRSTDNGFSWTAPIALPGCQHISPSSSQGCMYPVIGELNPSPRQIVVVFASSEGLKYTRSTDNGATWLSSPNSISGYWWYQPYVWYLSMASGYNFLTLTYDYRYYGVWSRTYNGTMWSDEQNVNASTGTYYDRHSSVAIDDGGQPVAAWCAQRDNDYRILLRRGHPDNSWDTRYYEFPKQSGISNLYPSLTFAGWDDEYTRFNIAYHRTNQQVVLGQFDVWYPDEWYWSDQTLSASGQYPNMSLEAPYTGAPFIMWADLSANPYGIPLWSDGALRKATATKYEHHRRVVLQDEKGRSTLSFEFSPIRVVSSAGDTVTIPFKSDKTKETASIDINNVWDYLGTDAYALPPDAKKLIVKVSIDARAKEDSSGKASTIDFTSHSLGVDLLKGSTRVSLLTNEQNAIVERAIDIGEYAGQEILIRPKVAFASKNTEGVLLGVGEILVDAENQANEKIAKIAAPTPVDFALLENYPNPFNPSTTIRYALPFAGNASLVVCDVLGRQIALLADGHHEAGYYSATWNASGVASGVYFARFTVTDELGAVKFNKVNKLLLMK